MGIMSDFVGPKVIFDPNKNPLPPLFPLPEHLNRYHSQGVTILAAPLFTAAMPNVKAMVVRHMLEEARKAGMLDGVHTLVEATSGNTGMSMGVIAPYYGLRVVVVVDRDLAPGKIEQLRMVGADIRYPDDGLGTIETARRLGEQPGWLNFNQYGNRLNVGAHCRYTGPHLWKKTRHKISVFSNGMGTAGTCLGVKAYFEEIGANVHVLGVACAEGSPVPGLRSYKKLANVTLDWRSLNTLEATQYEAYKLSLKLYRAGIMAGPSSGLALAGLLRFLEERRSSDFEGLCNADGRVIAVFGCGDTPMPYMEKYSTVLNGNDFDPLRF